MAKEKTVLIADFDEGGRQGTEIAFMLMENIEVLTAATKEEALAIIEGENIPDLVIVDPYLDIRFDLPVDRNEGTYGVMNSAISRGVKILIITSLPDAVEWRLKELDMQDSYSEMVKKGAGTDAICGAVVRALEG